MQSLLNKFLMSLKAMRERGVSMMELMVSTALMGGLALTTSFLLDNQVSTDKQLKGEATVLDLQRDIYRALDNVTTSGSACTNTFSSIDPTTAASFPITDIRNASSPPGQVVFSTGQKFENQLIELTSMTLTNWIPTTASNPFTGTADLEMTFTNLSRSKIPEHTKVKTKTFTVQIQRDSATGLITTCGVGDPTGVGGGGSDPYWEEGVETDEIWHDTSGSLPYVAIGTNSSSYPLTVNGTIEPLTGGGIKYPDGSFQQSGEPWKKSGTSVYFSGGNVGIGVMAPSIHGKLEVRSGGAIRIGNAYISGITGGCGYLGMNVWYDGSTYQIPNPTMKSAFLRLCNPEIGIFSNDSAGSTSFTQRWGIDASGTASAAGGGWSSCTIRTSSTTTSSEHTISASCIGSELLVGGGCSQANSIDLHSTYPSAAQTWTCRRASLGTTDPYTVYAICCT